MTERLKKNMLAMIAFSTAVYALVIISGDLTKLDLSNFNFLFLSLALLMAFLNYVLRMLRFEYYLRIAGITLNPTKRRLVFFSGFMMTITPGKVGELVKCYLIKKINQAKLSRTVPVVVNERISDIFGVLIVVSVSSLFFPAFFWPLLLGLAGIVAFLVLLRIKKIFYKTFGLAGRFRKISGLAGDMNEMYMEIRKLNGARRLLASTLISAVAWSAEGVALWFILKGFGVEISLWLCIFIYLLSSVAGIVSSIPGGLGVTEGGIFILLYNLGIGSEIAAASTILVRFATLWFSVLLGAAAFWYLKKQEPGI